MKYARINAGTVAEVFTPPANVPLDQCFHADVAAFFSVCPDNVTVGSTVDSSGHWTIATPPAAPAPAATPYPVLSPMQFYLAFTPSEMMAIKSSTDALVKEFYARYQLAAQLNHPIDPNLVSVQEGLAYLSTPTTATPPGPGILASQTRVAQILAGVPQ